MSRRLWGMGSLETPFQRSGFKTQTLILARFLRSKAPTSSHLVASVLISLSLLVIAPFGLSTANATTCTSSGWSNPWVATSTTTYQDMNFDEWAGYNGIASSCLTFARVIFTTAITNHHAITTANVTNSWVSKFSSCMKGQSASLWSPSSYANWTRCTITTAFVPSTSVIIQDFDTVKTKINSHVPLAYVSVLVVFFNNIANNWGTTACVAKNLTFTLSTPGTGSLSTNNATAGTPIAIAIPCSPPTAIYALRYLMVIGVWAMAIWFIYGQVISFLKDVTA